MGAATPSHQEMEKSAQGHTIPPGAGWGEQLDAVASRTDHDKRESCLLIEQVNVERLNSDTGDESISLSSGKEEDDTEPFTLSLLQSCRSWGV